MDTMKRDALLAAAKKLCDLMYEWNVVDIYELMVDNPANGGSIYHHTQKALEVTLRHLGTANTSDFYQFIHEGGTPLEALEMAKQVEADRAY